MSSGLTSGRPGDNLEDRFPNKTAIGRCHCTPFIHHTFFHYTFTSRCGNVCTLECTQTGRNINVEKFHVKFRTTKFLFLTHLYFPISSPSHITTRDTSHCCTQVRNSSLQKIPPTYLIFTVTQISIISLDCWVRAMHDGTEPGPVISRRRALLWQAVTRVYSPTHSPPPSTFTMHLNQYFCSICLYYHHLPSL